MTDQTLEDKVRKLAARFRQEMEPHTPAAEYMVWGRAAEAVESLLPTPPPPTLADMTSEERAGCERMQCDVGGEDTRAVIFNPHWEDGSARIMWPDGVFTYPNWERVTPRPDLPRFMWPGDTPTTAPALPEGWRLADHETYGRVIVTSTAPDADGDVCFVAPVPGIIGNDWHLCDPDELRYLDQ